MKKLLLAVIIILTLIVGALFWLAGSVGPETAPDDVRTIELDVDA